MNCAYFIVQYVPNAASGEADNIGVILLEKPIHPDKAAQSLRPFAGARFLKDWTCLNRFGSDTDVEVVLSIVEEIKTRISAASDERNLLPELLQELGSASNGIVLGTPRGLVTDDPQKKLDELAEKYLPGDSISGSNDRSVGAGE
jgi:Protein of unknown function (DUF3037)